MRPTVAGIGISHPERVFFPESGITKLELARYAEAVAPWMLPQVAGRPLTLVRCDRGIDGPCVFMRHSKVWGPEPLDRVRIPEKKKVGEYLVASSVAGLVALAQMDVIEVHTWNTRVPDVERPDRVVLDLDPGPEVRWPRVIEAARLVRAALRATGLESFVKTTGGAGLHVVVPLVPDAGWAQCLDFSRRFAEALARHDPRSFTVAMPKAGRERKILLDYLRNNRTNTSVAAYSVRARKGAPVSVPISWDELEPGLRSDRWTLRTLPRRLARAPDPWARYPKVRQRLGREAAAALDAIR